MTQTTNKKVTLNDLQTAIYNQNNVIVSLQSQIVTLQAQVAQLLATRETPAHQPVVASFDGCEAKPVNVKFRTKLQAVPVSAPKSTSPSPKLKKAKGQTQPSPAPTADPYQTLLNVALADVKQGIKSARFNEKIIPQCDYDLRVFCSRTVNKQVKAYRMANGVRLSQFAQDLVTLYGVEKAAMLWE